MPSKEYVQRHKELGLCTQCSRPADAGTRCSYHAELHRKEGEARANKIATSGVDLTSEEIDEIHTQVHQEFSEYGLTLTVKSLHIQTLEDALVEAQVDLEKYEVDRYVVNSWEVTMRGRVPGAPPQTCTNYQVKVFLKPRIPEPVDVALRQLIEQIPAWIPPENETFENDDSEYALEMALYDLHFGKLAWSEETQQGDYDVEIAAQTLIDGAKKCLRYADPFAIKRIFFPFGNDFLHIENYQGTTPIAKNILDVDTRLPNVIQKSLECIIDVIKLCRDVAPIEILWIPGNHDMHSSYYLSEVLKQRFRADDRVVVDNSPPWRKARLWGSLLVGWTHDANRRQSNVVNMLPQFFPELWGKSKYREWHTGHKHTKREWKYQPTTSAGGTLIRQIPTLSPIDAWHYQEGFVDAVPAGESFIWSENNGIVAHFTAYCGSHQPL